MISQIFKLLKKTKGVVILVQDEKPAYVVLPFDEYEKMTSGEEENKKDVAKQPASAKKDTEYALLDKINKDIEIWKAAQEKDDFLEVKEDPNDIKIEEIPY